MKKLYVLSIIILVIVTAAGCKVKSFEQKDRSIIICSNEIIDDLVNTIGGDFIKTNIAIRKGNDPHSYTATERDIISITDSSLIIYNGGGLEGRLEWALGKIGNITPAISIMKNIPEEKFIYKDDVLNPHIWHDAMLWKSVAIFIADNLATMNEENHQIYYQNEEIVLYTLEKLDKYIKEQVALIPAEKRILVTEHDAFAYFGRAYGFETLSMQGVSTYSEVSSIDINNLADILIEKNVDTIFLEATVPDRNIRLLQATLKAQGHSVKIGGILYSDTLGNNNTYDKMMRHNIDTIVRALSK